MGIIFTILALRSHKKSPTQATLSSIEISVFCGSFFNNFSQISLVYSDSGNKLKPSDSLSLSYKILEAVAKPITLKLNG